MNPGEGSSGSNSTGEMLLKKAAAAASSRGAPAMDPQKGRLPGSDSDGGMLQKEAVAVAASSRGSAAMGALQGNRTAQDREESDAVHQTSQDEGSMGVSGGMVQKDSPMVEVDAGLSRGRLQKQSPMVDADAGLSGDMLHEHLTDEADTGLSGDALHEHLEEEADAAKGIKESDSDETEHGNEHAMRIQEAVALIEQLNIKFIGEQISDDEFLALYKRLPSNPRWHDLDKMIEDDDLDDKEALHALYRFRYLKRQFTSKEELRDDELKSLLDKSEDDLNQEFLEEECFFRRFEKDMTLDWFFHPDYEFCSSLSDYQRLVLQNYGYYRWGEYHRYLHSYEMEEEYLQYYKKLSEKLKWMEDYIGIYCPSLTWNLISDRGAYQAVKIAATDFRKITPTLAYKGYHEYVGSLNFASFYFTEYDGLYFEIWKRVTKQSASFEAALKELCKLKMFPVRQYIIEGALKCEYTMKRKEEEVCTKAVSLGDDDDKARELIKDAVLARVEKPKNYADYISKKIEIARMIGILPEEKDAKE